MKKRVITAKTILLFIFILISVNALFSQITTKLKVHLVEFNKDTPIPGADVTLINIIGNYSSQSAVTDNNGDAEFRVIKDGIYIIAAKNVFSDVAKEIVYIDYETLQEQTKTIRLKDKKDKDNFDQKIVDIQVNGKELDGTVKPLKNAKVYLGDGEKSSDGYGMVSFQHSYKLGTYVSFVASAEGYKTTESAFIVGTKPAINDKGEVTLEKNPLTTVPVQVLVLENVTDKPIPNATVSINLRTPQTVNGESKSIWGVEYSDDNGIADWTGKTGQPLSADLMGKTEIFVNASKEGFEDVMYKDIPADMLKPSADPVTFTIWMKENIGSGDFVLENTVPAIPENEKIIKITSGSYEWIDQEKDPALKAKNSFKLKITKAPPKSFNLDEGFQVSVQGEAGEKQDITVNLKWYDENNSVIYSGINPDYMHVGGSFTGGSYVPTSSVDFAVQVPKNPGNKLTLKISVCYHCTIEPYRVEWVEYVYKRR